MKLTSHGSTAQDSAQAVTPWWLGATIYQIYPRSFMDSNGDGIGDLAGITQKLDHVAALGVDAIWISPFYTSPMADFGYDIADYCNVDPIFGTLADFDALVARARELGLKVIVDQVYAHTSNRHAWFQDSRSSRSSAHADWYVWADARPDGSPPSNWQSVFGGPAWCWDARRGQYYLHNFLKEQPQLNVHNPAVQEALLEVAKFWLDRGVSGFRIDALNFTMHDPQLRDNPPAPEDGKPRTRPFDFQLQTYNQSHPDIVHFIERLQALIASYPDTFSLAEVGGRNALAEMKAFTQGSQRLDSAYGFDFLYAPQLTPALVAGALSAWSGPVASGWPSWAFENHDAPRALSRWADEGDRAAFARLKALLFFSLRGNLIVYQGEELGLLQDEVPFESLQDPEAIANWPLTLSRDGVRTPLPWVAEDGHGGFTQGDPWLPVSAANRERAVDRQSADPASLLRLTTALLRLRKATATLMSGDCTVDLADETRLVLRRTKGASQVQAVFNFSGEEQPWPADLGLRGRVLASVNFAQEADVEAGKVKSLPPHAALWIDTGET
ncbi:alpha-amylase family glycosyl hydrolase [Novosphingobium sp. 1949]|uniref:Alpha-amylase family glycosyl hydrolase n=1 Tax=Novosphingobium organovorum TaxID=2930092 RepID=A0ABT0B8P5_9SPHN|nr:alpha-amylase family glycosyl hydrolase [Novosphingobium organovorum]MCJ2181445.1 alpha-amylase family glycosyl hydrolase [Novosphingobium organovorum]